MKFTYQQAEELAEALADLYKHNPNILGVSIRPDDKEGWHLVLRIDEDYDRHHNTSYETTETRFMPKGILVKREFVSKAKKR